MLLFAFVNAASAQIYRIEKPDGSVEYTDQKPAAALHGVSEVELPELENSSDTRSITRSYDQILKEEARAEAKNNTVETLRQNTLAPLRKNLREAKAALSEGQKKREGDYIRNANGGTRLSPSYLNRVRVLEAAVTAAETKLQSALRY